MLYKKVVELCRPYLGPAAEAFLNRQLFTHMKLKHPEELTESHLALLAKWCLHSGREIMEEAQAREMSRKIINLEEMNFIRNLFKAK